MPAGKKIPTQSSSARGKTVKEDLGKAENERVANHSVMGWAESIKWCKSPVIIVHGRVKDDVEKQ